MIEVWMIAIVSIPAIPVWRPGIGTIVWSASYSRIPAIVDPDILTIVNIDIDISFAIIDIDFVAGVGSVPGIVADIGFISTIITGITPVSSIVADVCLVPCVVTDT